jgi:hypothetical protein
LGLALVKKFAECKTNEVIAATRLFRYFDS